MKAFVARAAFAASLCLIAEAATAATAVYISSEDGERVGAGQTYTFNPPAASSYMAPEYVDYDVQLRFDNWIARFGLFGLEKLTPKDYENAIGGSSPLLKVSAPTRFCPSPGGWFRVYEASYSAQTITSFAADFVQVCEGKTLFGAVRIDSNVPLLKPEPYARVVAELTATEGETVILDGSRSFDRASSISYAWQQLQGTTVLLSNSAAAKPGFVAPELASGSEVLRFRLTVTDAEGNTDAQEVSITVYDRAAPRNRALFDSAPGEALGHGLRYLYSEPNSTVTARASTGRIQADVRTAHDYEYWTVSAGVPIGDSLALGMHAGATRSGGGYSSGDHIDVGGLGYGCNQTLGWYDLIEFEASGDTVQKLAIDFVQLCDGVGPPLFGAIRFNSAVPLERTELYAVAGGDTRTLDGRPVVLDARQSYSRKGRTMTYAWHQVAGPPAIILDPASAVSEAWVEAPPEGTTLEFELTVTDSAGIVDTDRVKHTILGRGVPQWYVHLQCGPGALVCDDESLFLLPGTYYSGAGGDSHSLSFTFTDPEYWTLQFKAPGDEPLALKTYTNAQSYPRLNQAAAEFYFSRSIANCYNSGGDVQQGSFKVNGYSFDASNVLLMASVDLKYQCRVSSPPAYVRVRYHTLPDGYTHTDAGRDLSVLAGKKITLDGRFSSDPEGAGITAYRWVQSEGPAVTLDGTTTPQLSFSAPSVPAGQSVVLKFLLGTSGSLDMRDLDEVVVTVYGTGTDTDGDGVLDATDAFPANAGEWNDRNANGVGDNAELAPASSGGGSGGGSFDLRVLLLLLMGAARRARAPISP